MRQRTTELPVADADDATELIGLVSGTDARVPVGSLFVNTEVDASDVDAATTGHTELTGPTVQDQLDEADAALTALGGAANEVDVHRAEMSAHDALAIDYDNSTSGLAATDAQAAIDEVDGLADQGIADAAAAQGSADQGIADAAAAQSAADNAQSTADAAQAAATQASLDATQASQDAGDALVAASDAEASAADRVAKAGDTMTGPLLLNGDPAQNLAAATKQYVDGISQAAAAAIQNLQDDVDNNTTLVSDFQVDLDSVTTDVGDKVDKAGDTMTGELVINKSFGALRLKGAAASQQRVVWADENDNIIWQVTRTENGFLNFSRYSGGAFQDVPLSLAADGTVLVPAPTQNLSAATKKYVDDNIGTGGGGTGNLLVLGATEPIPGGTPADTVIVRTGSPVSGSGIQIVGTPTTSAETGGGDTVLAVPSGVQDDDVLIAVIRGQASDETFDFGAAGWSRIGVPYAGPSLNRIMGMYAHVVTDAGSEPSDYTFVYGGGGARITGTMFIARGVDTAQIVDGYFDQYEQATTSPNPVSNGTFSGTGLMLWCAGSEFTASNDHIPVSYPNLDLVSEAVSPASGDLGGSRTYLYVGSTTVDGAAPVESIEWGAPVATNVHAVILKAA